MICQHVQEFNSRSIRVKYYFRISLLQFTRETLLTRNKGHPTTYSSKQSFIMQSDLIKLGGIRVAECLGLSRIVFVMRRVGLHEVLNFSLYSSVTTAANPDRYNDKHFIFFRLFSWYRKTRLT